MKEKIMLTGHPFIIRIKNTTDEFVPSFKFLSPHLESQSKVGFNWHGNYESEGVQVSSEVEGVTYQQIVNHFNFMPFRCGFIYVFTGSLRQLLTPIDVGEIANDEESIVRTLLPIFSPYEAAGFSALSESLKLNGYTTLKMDIYPKSDFKIYFYPELDPKVQVSNFELPQY